VLAGMSFDVSALGGCGTHVSYFVLQSQGANRSTQILECKVLCVTESWIDGRVRAHVSAGAKMFPVKYSLPRRQA
jgi:hypothetical protein